MIIVFVIDMYDQSTNGTSTSARRFAFYLRQRGHEVRIVSTGCQESGKYVVSVWRIPLVEHFAKKQHFIFAKAEEAPLRQALRGADIAHLFLPMPLERKALRIACELGVPCSAAFHLQPENITYNIHLGHAEWLSRWIYKIMLDRFYCRVTHIHCPSAFIARQLETNHYQAKLHVISNGITADFKPGQSEEARHDGDFHILMIGRLSPEKRQDLLIKAVELSPYRGKIHIHFAGLGPCEKHLRRLGADLDQPPTFGFYGKNDLIRLIRSCDLYVHASDVDIEAISCLEAMACGLVPIISDWIEHPQERLRLAADYARIPGRCQIAACVKQAEAMFDETIADARKVNRKGT
ncbi:MAG: glycosyltransferase [Clostridiaceae bacterium]|nr:glycosyltransferase [Clostridiaceae bacterium]